jgi:4-hydroxy-tetrahydrodipicolinate reductase
MKIGIIGYGSMGHEVEGQAKLKNIEISDIIDIDNPLSESNKYDFDVAIDFSLPDQVKKNLEVLCKLGKNVVIGTTGWADDYGYIENLVSESNICCVWGSNFSIGMNMLFKITGHAAAMLNNLDAYDIMVHELHHHRKQDSPSGSAITLANLILQANKNKSIIEQETKHGKITPSELHVSSTRGGEIAGTHTIYIDSMADTLELTHRAKNRSGFALGALAAAEWIGDKKGFFEFKDIVDEILGI